MESRTIHLEKVGLEDFRNVDRLILGMKKTHVNLLKEKKAERPVYSREIVEDTERLFGRKEFVVSWQKWKGNTLMDETGVCAKCKDWASFEIGVIRKSKVVQFVKYHSQYAVEFINEDGIRGLFSNAYISEILHEIGDKSFTVYMDNAKDEVYPAVFEVEDGTVYVLAPRVEQY